MVREPKSKLQTTNVKSKLRDYVIRMSYQREIGGGSRITQDEISLATGVSQPTVSMWMNQDRPLRRIDTEAWVALAKFVGVKPEELLDFGSDESPEKTAWHFPTESISKFIRKDGSLP